jgi:hypothetical protein
MNAMEHKMGDSPTSGNAPDVSKKANLVIWGYFFGFGIALYLMISFVNVYFRIESDKELYLKVGSVESKELEDYKNDQQLILDGKKGLLQGKKNIALEDAMIKVLQVAAQ